MRRRRRPAREIAFSFDSFLDVVANVVGIILRLILVAWVGARSYKAFHAPAAPPPAPLADAAPLPEPTDPLGTELERQRRRLADAQALLLEQLHGWEQARDRRARAGKELDALGARRAELRSLRAALEGEARAHGRAKEAVVLSLKELQERGRRLTAELEALRRAPPAKQTLRYHTPVSRPVQSEELLFECSRGRVTLIDIGALLDEVRQAMRDKEDQLRGRWEVRDVTAPVEAFRLRYTLERERGLLEGFSGGVSPDARADFRYGVASWEVEAVRSPRGETAEEALAPGSAFRRVADNLDPRQTAVTLWVYPDSFALYRRLRDYLHRRDVVVAGRPLPEGVPIASSRRGTRSRGQ